MSKSDDVSAGGSLMLNRRLGKPGRNINFRGTYNYTNSESEQFSTSTTEYYQQTLEEQLEILNRYITTPTKSYNYSLRFTYSEPIFKGGFLQFSYNFQYSKSKTDNSTYDMPNGWTIPEGYLTDVAVFNPDLSKTAEYDYYNHQADVQFRWIRERCS